MSHLHALALPAGAFSLTRSQKSIWMVHIIFTAGFCKYTFIKDFQQWKTTCTDKLYPLMAEYR